MNVDNEQISEILKALGSEQQRKIIDLIKLSGLKYTEMLKIVEPYKDRKYKSGKMAHHIKVLRDAGLIKVDESKIYYLTRLGVQAYELVQQFKILCMKYDISDCEADGKPIKVIVIEGRKL